MTILIYGTNPVREALAVRPSAFRRIFLSKHHAKGPLREIADAAKKKRISISTERPENLTQRARSDAHQGIIAEVEPFINTELSDLLTVTKRKSSPAFFLVLDSIQDPHNFGTLIRSAVCSGARGVIFPRDRAAGLTAAVAKASAGAIEHIPLCRVTNIAGALENLKQNGLWIFGLTPAGETPLHNCDFTGPAALVVGGEGKGIRPLVLKKCDYHVSIPMAASFESLNVSAAGAVAMFEVLKQRQTKNKT